MTTSFGPSRPIRLVGLRNSSSPRLLITAPLGDAHATSVGEWLSARQVAVRYLSADSHTQSPFALDPTNPLEILDFMQPAQTNVREKTVWSRRLATNTPSPQAPVEIDQLCREESRSVTGGILAILTHQPESGIRFVDDPSAMFMAEHKLLQLYIAQQLKIPVPPTLVTNDTAEASKFLSKGPALIKGISGYERISPFVTSLEPDLVDGVKGIPVMIQREVVSQAHLRILVCGSEALAWRRSRSNHEPPDWRQIDPHGAGFRRVKISDKLAAMAIGFVSAIGLSTSVQDWAIDRGGRAWFLESNPQGAWLFLPGAEDSALPFFCRHLVRSGSYEDSQ